MRITFGTSGWRGIMGEDFTFHNVRVVVQSLANYLQQKYQDRSISVFVTYDTRFLSERFAFEAARILAKNKIHVFISDRDAPSQALAFQIIQKGAQAGINFTASFNPPRYNGLKLNVETGAPALPEVTDRIEEEIKKVMPHYSRVSGYFFKVDVPRVNFQRDYLNFLQGKINFDVIKKSGLKIALDLLYGTSREYLDSIFEENGINVEEIHGYVDPYFGGVVPSCTEENLTELKTLVLSKKCHLGIATDADGDRFGILDERGRLVHPNYILAMLLDYLVREKGWRGGVARSIATTHLLDRIAREYNLPLFRTRVGFKYIADLWLKGEIIFGGEESACFAVKDHLPEKDGIFAGLLVAEMLAHSGKTLSELKSSLFERYGEMAFSFANLPVTPERAKKLASLVANPPVKFAGQDVKNIITLDGLKLNLSEDAWVLVRLSGTEPIVRCYAEANTRKEANFLLEKGLETVA